MRTQTHPPKPCSGRHRNAGFSLLELVVALFLLTVGLLPVAGIVVHSNRLRADNETVYRLHILAANRLEALKRESTSASGYVDLYPTGTEEFGLSEAELRNLPVSNVSGTVTAQPTNAGVDSSVLLGVTIQYSDAAGQPREQTLTTFLNKGTP